MNQHFNRRFGIALIALVTLMAVLFLPTYIIAQDFPPIPHTLEKRSDCLACHEEGKLKSPKIPEDHAGRTNDICQDCHKPVTELESEEVSEPTAGPPPIPHTLENRGDCLACHEEGKLGATRIPEDHAGRTNDVCQDCHKPVTEATVAPEETGEPEAAMTPDETGEPETIPTPEETEETMETTDPLAIPHTLVGRENCLECHTSPEATPVTEAEEEEELR